VAPAASVPSDLPGEVLAYGLDNPRASRSRAAPPTSPRPARAGTARASSAPARRRRAWARPVR
jgi:hypothetical protein